jgi:ubiquitin carboxyl-terminal hydrolase 47
MTPSFRRSVFQWRYNEEKDKKESKCIPLQLQKLFARLKYSNCESIKTNDLTTSFGWSSRESFQQNDVEELLRVGK